MKKKSPYVRLDSCVFMRNCNVFGVNCAERLAVARIDGLGILCEPNWLIIVDVILKLVKLL